MRRVGIGKRSAVSFQQTTHYISHVIRSFAQSDVGLVGFRLAHDLCRGVQLNALAVDLSQDSVNFPNASFGRNKIAPLQKKSMIQARS